MPLYVDCNGNSIRCVVGGGGANRRQVVRREYGVLVPEGDPLVGTDIK